MCEYENMYMFVHARMEVCLHMHVYIIVHINMYIYIHNIAVLLIICRFESTLLLKYANPCRQWTFQRFARAAQKKGRNGRNEKI